MEEVHHLLLLLLVIFVAAQVGAEIAQRLKAPVVVGEILAGVLIGPTALNWIPIENGMAPIPLEMLAEVGVVFLLFSVGLETRLSDMRRIGRIATQVAVLGVVLPFGLGLWWAAAQGYSIGTQAFVASAFVATSVGITSAVLRDMGLIKHTAARVILAAAILDDILAMLILGAVVALVPGKPLESVGVAPAAQLTILALQAAAFVLVLTIFLPRVVRRHHRVIDIPISPHSPFTLSIVLCLSLAVLASKIGLAAIIGAFLAGTLLAEVGEKYNLEKRLRPLLWFLTPFFFVLTGMKVDASVFLESGPLSALLTATALAIAAKLIGCSVGALKLGKRNALAVGIGMTPRGEVGLIIAALGLGYGVLNKEIYAIIVGMSILTSLIAPPFLAMVMKKPESPHIEEKAVS